MAVNEGLVLSSTDLNDGTNYSIRALDFTPPRKRQEWVQGADADGAALVRDPLVENRTITIRLRVQAQSTMDLALGTKVGALVDLLEECEKQPGGVPLVWTPATGTKSLTFYVLSGEVTALPIDKTGDNSGYFRKAPMVELRLDCKSYGYGAEVTNAATVTNTNPVQILTLANVTGDVPAEGRLVLTDAATQSRRHAEFGLEQRYYSAGVPRVLDQFGSDTIGSGLWVVDSGGGTISVSGGLLVPSSTAEKRLHRTDAGANAYTDTDTIVKVTTGASVASGSTGLIARWADDSNFLYARLNFAGASSNLTIHKRTATVDSSALATSTNTTTVASTNYWVRLKVEAGSVLTASYYAADPHTGGAVTSSVSYTLSGGEATTFASGRGGLRLVPAGTDYRWDDFRIDPLAGSTEVVLDSESLILLGGTETTRTGAYTGGTVTNHVIRGTLTTTVTAIAGLSNLGHVGTYRVKARVYAAPTSLSVASDFNVRLSWKEGDGPLRSNDFTSPTTVNGFSEVDLGLVIIPEKTLGGQRWSGQIEAYSAAAGDILDIDYLELIPTEVYGKGRMVQGFDTPSSFSVRDEFDQTAGVLAGKTLPVGGTWAGAGDADDFSVETTGHTAARTPPGADTANTGRFMIAGSATPSDVEVQADIKESTVLASNRLGVLARYTDTSNFVFAGLAYNLVKLSTVISVFKRVAGTITTLKDTPVAESAATWYRVRLLVDAAGRWYVWYFSPGGSAGYPLAFGQDSALATGGALATGKSGFYSEQTSNAITQNVDNFFAAVPTSDAVCFSGRSAEIRHDSAIRQDASGTFYGPIQTYRGGRILIPPAGSATRTSRIVAKARRNDVDISPDDQIADSTTWTVHYTPRYLVIPR